MLELFPGGNRIVFHLENHSSDRVLFLKEQDMFTVQHEFITACEKCRHGPFTLPNQRGDVSLAVRR